LPAPFIFQNSICTILSLKLFFFYNAVLRAKIMP